MCVECQNGVLGQEAILPALARDNAHLVDRLRALLCGARGAGVRVVHATYDGVYGGHQIGTARLWRTLNAGGGWRAGDVATKVVPELLGANDIVVPRHHGLYPTLDTELLPVLGGLGVHTVVLAGVSLNVALPFTAGHMSQAGFNVVVPRDAVGATPTEYGVEVLNNTIAFLGRLATVEELLTEWGRIG
ncbi:isochorismatase family protein [Mycobacterium sp. MUNTM1]